MALRSDLIQRIARKNPSLGEEVVAQIFTVFFSAIVDRINSGSRVELRGFGSFSTRSYIFKDATIASKMPKDGYRRVYFRPSDGLVRAVNSQTKNV